MFLKAFDDAGVEQRGSLARLFNVGKYERALQSLHGPATAFHEIERNVQRCGVGIVAVVDNHAAALALLHLEAHGYGLKLRHALGDGCRRNHEI